MIRKIMMKSAVACLALTLTTSCGDNAKKEEDPKDQAEKVNEEVHNRDGEKDAERLSEAFMGNLYEIMSSETAASKATTSEVKKMAEMIKEAHTKMNTDLKDLATRKNITVPADLTDEQKRDLDKLNEKTGIDFDKEYTQQMKNKHEDAVKKYEDIADNSKDADIKSWATNTVPEVKSHLTMVESTWETIKDMKDKDGKKEHKAIK
jgi:putative membrane protein